VLTLTTMVRAGVAIRGSVTWPSVYTHRTWLLVNQAQHAGNCPASWEFDRCRPAPRERPRLASSGVGRRDDLRVQYNTRIAEADRIAEFKEVFLRRLEKATGCTPCSVQSASQGQPQRAAVAAVSDPLNRSTFPRAPEEVLLPTVETVELEQEQALEAWADAHPHETVALQMVYDHRTIPARYCPSCRELRTLREEIPFIRRYFEQPTWRIWLDVMGLLTAALLFAHWALWGL
jgi:hypothetical protein